MQYAVRGAVPIAAGHLQAQLIKEKTQGIENTRPFDKVIFCNIGNPQAVGQKPLTYYQQVTSLMDHPKLLDDVSKLQGLFHKESIEVAQEFYALHQSALGAYTDSKGFQSVRESVAKFIERRDGYSADPNHILLSNGASTAIQQLLTAIIANPNDSIMIPIPQYPIYTALIRLLNGQEAGYFMNEEKGWAMDIEELERSYEHSKSKGHTPRAMVIINPGNPTGSVLSYEDIAEVIKFCERRNLVLLSDEVYQENIYTEKPFHSAKKVMSDLNCEIELASFHSTSKGFIGECGRRGGYMEMCNFDQKVTEQIEKLASSSLCSNTNGQLMTGLMVNPPTTGEAAEVYNHERDAILSSLKLKSQIVHSTLNDVPGVSCQPLEGAMYAFPNLDLPTCFTERAKEAGMAPDALYAMELLQSTGICGVPGSGFEQKQGTHHIRLTFLPPTEEFERALKLFKDFHVNLK